ncbi:MAG: hypothetical protein H0X29_09605 [Parachlamydiaceae bacterium]|nr:hypothetical protein [Parachlamydiaceae bacterium]
MKIFFKLVSSIVILIFTITISSISYGDIYSTDSNKYSLSENQKILSIDSVEFSSFKSISMPSVEILNFKFLQLEDISWINSSFPNLKRMNVTLRSLGTGREYGRKILFLLQQLTAFPYLENVFLEINNIPNNIYSDETEMAIVNLNNLKELTFSFTMYRGNFNHQVYFNLESRKEKLKLLTDTIINFQYDLWAPHGGLRS